MLSCSGTFCSPRGRFRTRPEGNRRGLSAFQWLATVLNYWQPFENSFATILSEPNEWYQWVPTRINGTPSHRISHQRSITSVPGPNGSSQGYPNHKAQQEYQSQAAINRQPSSLTQASETSSGTHQSTPATSAPNTSSTNVASSGALKIKVFFEDDLIAIRVPSNIRFQDLKKKLKDRLKLQEDIIVQYKDEPSNSYAEMTSDRDFDVALGRNPKLTVYVNYA